MRLLLDTNVALPIVDGRGRALPGAVRNLVVQADVTLSVSVATIWEVALKHRLGKLPLPCAMADWPDLLSDLDIQILPVRTEHVVEELAEPPPTRDPFDRLFLAICAAEQLQLVTLDEKLIGHPLAWRPA